MRSIRSPYGLPLLPFLVALISACYDGGVVCTTEGVSSFVVEIRDSLSGQALAAQSRVTVTDGAYVDTLWVGLDGESAYQSGSTFERAGTYTVAVTSPGYQTWSRQNVVVPAGVCHVETARVLALLQPE